MSEIPETLRDQLRRHEVIPFVGAGVSLAVKHKESGESLFPSWKTLLEELSAKLAKQTKGVEAERMLRSIKKGSEGYLDAAQIAWDNLADPNCPRVIGDIFNVLSGDARESSLFLARSVWRLGSRVVFTTNYDPVLTWACPNPGDHRPLYRQPTELAQLLCDRDSGQYVTWHLHGSVFHSTGEIVFTREQYEKFYKHDPRGLDRGNYAQGRESAYIVLSSLLTTKTFLFIGFSLNDVYFKTNLEYISHIFQGGAGSFYVLLKKGERLDPSLTGVINVIEFEDYETDLLEKLNEMCEIAGGGKEPVTGRDFVGTYRKSLSATAGTILLTVGITGVISWMSQDPETKPTEKHEFVIDSAGPPPDVPAPPDKTVKKESPVRPAPSEQRAPVRNNPGSRTDSRQKSKKGDRLPQNNEATDILSASEAFYNVKNAVTDKNK